MTYLKKKPLIALLISLAVCILLFSLYFIIASAISSGEKSGDESAGVLIDLNSPGEITSLTLTNEKGVTGLYNYNGTWRFKDHSDLPVSEEAVSSLIGSLRSIIALRIIDDPEDDLSIYGLKDPAIRISFTSGESEKNYSIGDRSSYYNGYYFRTNAASKVYVVEGALYDSLNVSTEELLGTDEMPAISSDSDLRFTDLSGRTVTVDKESELFDLLLTLGIGKYIDFGEENYHVYGLDLPAQVVINGTDVVYFSIGEGDEFIYLRINRSEIIYTAETGSNEILMKYIRNAYGD